MKTHRSVLLLALVIGTFLWHPGGSDQEALPAGAITLARPTVSDLGETGELQVPVPYHPIRRAQMSRQDAMIAGVNRLEELLGGSEYQLEHPLYSVRYSASGLTFQPRCGGAPWSWSLAHYGTANENFISSDGSPVAPRAGRRKTVMFERGEFVERYLSELRNIEQQFVIEQAPELGLNEDLFIRGDIRCVGEFERHNQGWLWRDPATGAVTSLGQVSVFDADGDRIPASMTANQYGTEIIVDGTALLAARYPVTVDPEIGVNDFLISAPGVTDLELFHARDPTLAYGKSGLCLVVWTGAKPSGKSEIFGQLVNAATGDPSGEQFQISNVGSNGNTSVRVYDPQIACDPDTGRFLVVWVGSNANNHAEIFGQLYSEIGQRLGDEIAISQMGDPTSIVSFAGEPSVVFNTAPGIAGTGQYLVSWVGRGESIVGYSVWGQFINPDGAEWGGDIYLNGLGNIDEQTIAVNTTTGEFMLAFTAYTEAGLDLFSRRLRRGGGPTDPLPSLVAATEFDETAVAIAFNAAEDEFLVAWDSYRSGEDLPFSVSAQLLNPEGVPKLSAALPISDVSDGSDEPIRCSPAVVWDSAQNFYVIAWAVGAEPNGEMHTVLASLAPGTGEFLGEPQIVPRAGTPALAHGRDGGRSRLLGAWEGIDPGDDTLFGQRHTEIHGRMFQTSGGGLVVPAGATEQFSETSLRINRLQRSFSPDVAYSATSDLYFVVWHQDLGSLGITEIFCQVLDSEGNAITPANRQLTDGLTHTGNQFDSRPRVAWNSQRDWFVVVFERDYFGDPLIISMPVRAHGINLAGPQRTISREYDSSEFAPSRPAIAYDSGRDQFLVVWSADDPAVGRGDQDFEIHARRLNGGGFDTTPDDFQVSRLQPPAGSGYPFNDPQFSAYRPEVCFDPSADCFHVVYEGRDFIDSDRVTGVYRTRVSAGAGSPHIAHSKLVAETGLWSRPDVAVDPSSGDYLVVWANEGKVFGQAMDTAIEMPTTAPIEIAGGPGACRPAVEFNRWENEYLVTWSQVPAVGEDLEIFARRIVAGGVEGGSVRLSDMGADGEPDYYADSPALIAGADGEYFVTWSGGDDRGGLDTDSPQIFGQRYEFNKPEIVSVRLQSDDLIIKFTCRPHDSYQIQASQDLRSWADLGGAVSGTDSGLAQYTDYSVIPVLRERYYRVTLVEP